MLQEKKEEERLRDLITECLAVFEGGECREDFDTSYVLLRIEDTVDNLRRVRDEIDERQDGRDMMKQLRLLDFVE